MNITEVSVSWNREPFFGGVEYHSELGDITGWYDSPELESSCQCWEGRRNEFFPTFADAEASLRTAL